MRYRLPVIIFYTGILLSAAFRLSFAKTSDITPNDADVNNCISWRGSEFHNLRQFLEPLREEYNLPALSGAVIYNGRIKSLGVTGVRKAGSNVNVEIDDQFHIGSCTKAMTATLIGMLVEQDKLQWDMTLLEVFPGMRGKMRPDYYNVTLKQLLAHRGGFPPPEKTWPKGKSFQDMHNLPGTARQQRLAYVKMMLTQKPEVKPGTKYIYSNTDYVVAGVIAEQAANTSWETLMEEMIFEPLGMKTAGFGAMGTPGRIDQPWQHKIANGRLQAVEPGRLSDNPPAIGPSSTVHCSIGDWARFIQFHLNGAEKDTVLLKKNTFSVLHTPILNGNYALGWVVTQRSWAGGRVLTHTGTNQMNFAVVWMAPDRNFAVLVASNQGGGNVSKACDKTASLLIKNFLLDKQ